MVIMVFYSPHLREREMGGGGRDIDRDRERHKERERERQRERVTETETETDTDRESILLCRATFEPFSDRCRCVHCTSAARRDLKVPPC